MLVVWFFWYEEHLILIKPKMKSSLKTLFFPELNGQGLEWKIIISFLCFRPYSFPPLHDRKRAFFKFDFRQKSPKSFVANHNRVKILMKWYFTFYKILYLRRDRFSKTLMSSNNQIIRQCFIKLMKFRNSNAT